MGDIEKDRKEIKKLLNKSKIKVANGMNDSAEMEQILQLMALHPAPQDEVSAYVENYQKLALSLLDEPLSDIPMGRVLQFQKVFEKELENFNVVYKKYKNKDIDIEAFLKQHEMFNAACESLDDALVENGDKETNYFPEMDKITENLIIIQSDETDIDKYYESLESLFAYFKSVSSFINQAIETNDKGLINAIAYNLGSGNLYLGDCLMDYIAEYNRKTQQV